MTSPSDPIRSGVEPEESEQAGVPDRTETPNSGPFHGEPARLHPAVLGVWLLQGILTILFMILLTGMMPLVGALILLFVLLSMGIRYLRFSWRLEPDALVIEEGLLIRKRRVIRRERIQSVDLERKISHRMLGVTEVRIEAIGAGGTEGKLDAVTPEAAEKLRRVLLGSRPRGRWAGDAMGQVEGGGEEGEGSEVPQAAGPARTVGAGADGEVGRMEAASREAEVEEVVRATVPPERLVVAGLTGGRVGVAAAIVGFLFQSIPEAWWTGGLGFLMETGPDPTSVVGLRILLVMAAFALLAGFFLSVVGTVFTHWDFTLSESAGTLAVRRGLFTEHRDTVPYRRIQAVLVEENLLRRLLGLGVIRVVVAGRAGTGGNEGTDLLLPIGRREEIYQLAREVVGVEGDGVPRLQSMPQRARTRRFARAGMAGLGAVVLVAAPFLLQGGGLPWEWLGAAFVLVLVLGLALAEGAYRGLGWADLGDHLVVREGVVNRRTSFVRTDRLQVTETSANPFQQIGGLATLHLRVARPVMAHSPRALDLGSEQAADLREALSRRIVPRPEGPRAVATGGLS